MAQPLPSPIPPPWAPDGTFDWSDEFAPSTSEIATELLAFVQDNLIDSWRSTVSPSSGHVTLYSGPCAKDATKDQPICQSAVRREYVKRLRAEGSEDGVYAQLATYDPEAKNRSLALLAIGELALAAPIELEALKNGLLDPEVQVRKDAATATIGVIRGVGAELTTDQRAAIQKAIDYAIWADAPTPADLAARAAARNALDAFLQLPPLPTPTPLPGPPIPPPGQLRPANQLVERVVAAGLIAIGAGIAIALVLRSQR